MINILKQISPPIVRLVCCLSYMITLFSLCFIPYHANAIDLKPNTFLDDNPYQYFKNIRLPADANLINTVFQDNQGLIWIGSKRGLFSYNGYDSQFFPIKPGAENRNIYDIIQLDSTHLCLGTGGGLLFFNLLTEKCDSVYTGMETIKSVRSLSMFDDKLWIGTHNEGVSYYDFADHTLHKVPLSSGESSSVIYCLEPADGKLYIGSYNGLSFYDPVKKSRESIVFPSAYGNLMVNSLLWDKEEACIWIGTEGYLFQYSLKDYSLKQCSFIPSNTFKTLALDDRGNLIIGTDNGLYVYNKTSAKTRHILHDSRNNRTLCNNIIWCCYVDKAKNVWLGTDYGLSLAYNYSTYQFIHISEITGSGDGNQFTALFGDSAGNYWLGGVNGLIFYDSHNNIRWYRTEDEKNFLRHNRIRSIYEDRDHDIWIATDGGIARFDSRSKKFVYYSISDSTGHKNTNWAYDIYEDQNSKLWIATYLGGLFVVDKQELLNHEGKSSFVAEWNYSNSTPALSNIVYQILADKNGYIWVNTQDGLVQINPSTKEISRKNSYLDKMVYDGGEFIWYATNNKISRINVSTDIKEQVYALPESSYIYSLTFEEDRLWFTSTGGISYLDRNTLQRGDIAVPNHYYQTGFYSSPYKYMFWGGEDGIISLSASAFKSLKNTSPVIIMSVWGNNNRRLFPGTDYPGFSLRYQQQIVLPYSERNMAVEFSGLNYSPETDNGIYYCLSSSDGDNWIKLYPRQNRISLINLNYGSYTLKIRNGNSDDSSVSPITSFEITILPPWYASKIAVFFYFILATLIIMLLMYRLRLRIKRNYERIERVKTLELSNLKIDFFTNISHELKTPLSLIIAPLSQLIGETKKTESRQKLELIYKNALRLNKLIHKVLDFKKIEHENEDELVKSNVELCSFVQANLDYFSSTLETKNIQKNFFTNKEQIWISLDALKIESVLINIFSNAIKYMPESGGRIDVSLTQRDNDVIIRIADTGRGISKEDLPYVFIRFFQSKNNAIAKNGSGIGLYIVKKAIELHNGRVEIESEGKDCGTTVTITLPLLIENDMVSSSTDKNSDMSDAGVPHISLLIIDDNSEMVSFLAGVFSKEYNCLQAFDGREGLTIACEHKPDLIIVDQMMPEMNGFEFCKALRNNQPTATIPVVMLTAQNGADTEAESIKAGIDAFIPKPFDLEKLRLRLNHLLKTRRSLEKALRIESITQPSDVGLEFVNEDEILLVKITSVIEEQLENTAFNVTMLSELVNMDKKQLYRKVKLLTGITPVDYIRQIRIKKAAMLLSQKKFSVSEVMYMVGYSNASYFSKCFVAEFKKTPKQYMSEEQ